MSSLDERVHGLLLGLASGDKNGGPFRMAVRLCESLNENGGEYTMSGSWEKMSNWIKGPPYDVDKAFDTGPTLTMVFRKTQEGINPTDAAKIICKTRTLFQGYPPIGINPAHRAIVLALLPEKFSLEKIKEFCQQENGLTHYHKASEECLILCTILARFLILGKTWEESLLLIQSTVSFESDELKMADIFNFQNKSNLSPSGFAPQAMKAALYFVHTSSNFTEAIDRSVKFAGSANFCPVLVGALAGARWGRSQIEEKHLNHVPCSTSSTCDYRTRLHNAAEELIKFWRTSNTKKELAGVN